MRLGYPGKSRLPTVEPPQVGPPRERMDSAVCCLAGASAESPARHGSGRLLEPDRPESRKQGK